MPLARFAMTQGSGSWPGALPLQRYIARDTIRPSTAYLPHHLERKQVIFHTPINTIIPRRALPSSLPTVTMGDTKPSCWLRLDVAPSSELLLLPIPNYKLAPPHNRLVKSRIASPLPQELGQKLLAQLVSSQYGGPGVSSSRAVQLSAPYSPRLKFLAHLPVAARCNQLHGRNR
jgi:hypothetical protein